MNTLISKAIEVDCPKEDKIAAKEYIARQSDHDFVNRLNKALQFAIGYKIK